MILFHYNFSLNFLIYSIISSVKNAGCVKPTLKSVFILVSFDLIKLNSFAIGSSSFVKNLCKLTDWILNIYSFLFILLTELLFIAKFLEPCVIFLIDI